MQSSIGPRGHFRVNALVWMLVLVMSAGCGADVASERDVAGKLALPLTVASADARYRLQGSFAVYADAVDAGLAKARLRADASASVLEVDLAPGAYAVLLEPGWTLSRRSGAAYEPVAAELQGGNPMLITISSGARTEASFQFVVDGRQAATRGTLDVAIDVAEAPPAVCGNGVREHGEACDRGEENGVYGCDRGCLFVCRRGCPLRVDPAATAPGDGSSWESPLRDLDAALADSYEHEIWIKGGRAPDQSLAVTLRNEAVLRGGFAGNERTPDERRASTPRTSLSRLTIGEGQSLVADRIELGGIPENPHAQGPELGLQVTAGSATISDSVLHTDVELTNARVRFERVDIYWPQLSSSVFVRNSQVAWVRSSLGERVGIHIENSKVLLQSVALSGFVYGNVWPPSEDGSEPPDSSELVLVKTRIANGSFGGLVRAQRAIIVDSTFVDTGSVGTPITGGFLFVFNSSFVNVDGHDGRGQFPEARVIKADKVEIAASTFYLNRCSTGCYADVRGVARLDATLFVQASPETFGRSAESTAHDAAHQPGNCFTFAQSAFVVPEPRDGRVLATAHPCPNGGDPVALERARKRLIALTEPYRAPLFDAEVGRYVSPDWWKKQSVRSGQCTDEGNPDPGRHYDLPCPPK